MSAWIGSLREKNTSENERNKNKEWSMGALFTMFPGN
jgi:hypothetical protein